MTYEICGMSNWRGHASTLSKSSSVAYMDGVAYITLIRSGALIQAFCKAHVQLGDVKAISAIEFANSRVIHV